MHREQQYLKNTYGSGHMVTCLQGFFFEIFASTYGPWPFAPGPYGPEPLNNLE